jgi:hypothetical protein
VGGRLKLQTARHVFQMQLHLAVNVETVSSKETPRPLDCLPTFLAYFSVEMLFYQSKIYLKHADVVKIKVK